MDRFADVLDMAQAHVELETERRIAQIRSEAATVSGSVYCIDCGHQIPAKRRKHLPGAVRCVPCQDLHESS